MTGLRFKIYSSTNVLVSTCLHIEDAIRVIGDYPTGARIRDAAYGRRIVFTQGKDYDLVDLSGFDDALDICNARLHKFVMDYRAKMGG